MPRRLLAVALVAVLFATGAAPAWAAFSALVSAGASFSAYTVPVPPNLRCVNTGGRTLLTWDAVTPPAGVAVDYVVTQPDARTVVTTTPSFTLPALLLVGQYSVRTRVAGSWQSAAAVRNVTNVLGLYICG